MKMALQVEDNKNNIPESWEKIRMRLKKEYGRATYTSWIKHLDLQNVEGSQVVLSVPTRFIKEWIQNNYHRTIESFWQQECDNTYRVDLIVRPKANDDKPESRPFTASGVDVSGQNIDVLSVAKDMESFGSPLDRRFTFDNFVVGDSNQLAFAASKALAESKNVVRGNNPYYLYSKVGLGKTHLMHAIALHMRKHQPGRKVIYLSAERFMYQFITALKNKNIMAFKDSFRNIDVLLIDDVQFICGKESTQEEFFHTVNALLDQKKQLVIAGDRPPSELEGMQERIRTRLGWGLVVDINSADFDLRLGILRSKVDQMIDATLPDTVLEFLASRVTSSIRELEGALHKVVAHATLMNKDITLESTQSILTDLLRANEKSITIADIQKKVAGHFGIKVADMSSANRSRSVARPRQIAMYLTKKLTTRSLSEIGRKFGGKDHTTVMHAVKRIDGLLEQDEELKSDVSLLERMINQ
mgnify:CR=1 FL=1